MARSTIGETGGFLPDAQAVDAMKVAFFMGAFVAYYKALEAGAPIAAGLTQYAQEKVEDLTNPPPKPDNRSDAFWKLSKTEKVIFGAGTVVGGLNPIVGVQSVAGYRGIKGVLKK